MDCANGGFYMMLTYWLSRREWIMETVLDGMARVPLVYTPPQVRGV